MSNMNLAGSPSTVFSCILPGINKGKVKHEGVFIIFGGARVRHSYLCYKAWRSWALSACLCCLTWPKLHCCQLWKWVSDGQWCYYIPLLSNLWQTASGSQMSMHCIAWVSTPFGSPFALVLLCCKPLYALNSCCCLSVRAIKYQQGGIASGCPFLLRVLKKWWKHLIELWLFCIGFLNAPFKIRSQRSPNVSLWKLSHIIPQWAKVFRDCTASLSKAICSRSSSSLQLNVCL